MIATVWAGWHLRVKTIAGWLLAMLISTASLAQIPEVHVQGGFLSDSLKIGEQTAYFLSARYPSTLNLLFPDSTHAFMPFEFQSKKYFPTETSEGISADSAVYYLTTFEVDRVQYLSLPVYVVHDADCTTIAAAADSILITQLVAHVPDTVATPALPLKANAAYQKVFYDFNVMLAFIILTIVMAIAIIVWVLFGGRIRRYFAVKKLTRNHASFVDRYNTFIAQVKSNFSSPATESALVTWKRYMEQLESRPYTKLTTRETQQLVKEETVTRDLGAIDRAIYGHNTTVVDSLENLRRFAEQQFQRKLKEVQHG